MNSLSGLKVLEKIQALPKPPPVIVTVVTTIGTMLVLDWRLTLLSLVVLPFFLAGSKRVGRHLRDLTRRSMQFNAAMSSQMTERFEVSGAQLVTLFGRHGDERAVFEDRAGNVRDIGIRTAVVSRTFFLGLNIVSTIGVAAPGVAGNVPICSQRQRISAAVAARSL